MVSLHLAIISSKFQHVSNLTNVNKYYSKYGTDDRHFQKILFTNIAVIIYRRSHF